MDLQELSDLLLWSALINYGILLTWFIVFIAAHDWLLRLHTRWFRLDAAAFDAVHYGGMAAYKIGVMLFNLAPFAALQLIR